MGKHDRGRIMWRTQYQERFNLLLRPCPFCASESIGLYLGPLPHVTCTECECDGPLVASGGVDARYGAQYVAGIKWNERPVRK